MIITNNHNLPLPFVRVAEKKNKPHVTDGFSVTELLQPNQLTTLKNRYFDKISDDAMDLVWSLFGNAIHQIMEDGAGRNDITEERLAMGVAVSGDKTINVSGCADLYDGETQTLYDYKSTSAWSIVYMSRHLDWQMQLNIYRFLYQQAGFKVNEMKVIAILKDFDKNKAKFSDGSYPKTPIVQIPIDKISDIAIGDYIFKRANELYATSQLPDDQLPECTPEERWVSETKYAVYKNNNKKASKVCLSEKEAEEYMVAKKLDYIKVREGSNKRCEEYCSAKEFCQQYKRMVAEQQEAEQSSDEAGE